MEMISALDAKTLLARINPRIAQLRRWIGHDHGDQPFWNGLNIAAFDAQRERAYLRIVANLLHVERAHARGRIHGKFQTLDEQAAWLATMEHKTCGTVTRAAQLPLGATLVKLRAGLL